MSAKGFPQQFFTPEEKAINRLTVERDRLRKSLLVAGFTDCGGELWKPPIPKEAKVLVDMLQETQAELEQARADVADLADLLAYWLPKVAPPPTPFAQEIGTPRDKFDDASALLAKHKKGASNGK